jgi:hypothetical protein
MKEHQKLKLTTTTSSAAGATPTVLGRTGDSDQLQPPPDKKLRLLRMLDNDSDEEAAQFGGASTVDELYGVMQEITGYLGPTVLTTDEHILHCSSGNDTVEHTLI